MATREVQDGAAGSARTILMLVPKLAVMQVAVLQMDIGVSRGLLFFFFLGVESPVIVDDLLEATFFQEALETAPCLKVFSA